MLVYVLSIPCVSLVISYCRSITCMSIFVLSMSCMLLATSYYRFANHMLCIIASECYQLMIYMFFMLDLSFINSTQPLNVHSYTLYSQYCMYPTCPSCFIYFLCVIYASCFVCCECYVMCSLWNWEQPSKENHTTCPSCLGLPALQAPVIREVVHSREPHSTPWKKGIPSVYNCYLSNLYSQIAYLCCSIMSNLNTKPPGGPLFDPTSPYYLNNSDSTPPHFPLLINWRVVITITPGVRNSGCRLLSKGN